MRNTSYYNLPQTIDLLKRGNEYVRQDNTLIKSKDGGTTSKTNSGKIDIQKIGKIVNNQFFALKADYDTHKINMAYYKAQLQPFYDLMISGIDKVDIDGLDTKKIASELKRMGYPNSKPVEEVYVNSEVKTVF